MRAIANEKMIRDISNTRDFIYNYIDLKAELSQEFFIGAKMSDLIQLKRNNEIPHIMGILNITPDSFSDGGSWLEPETAVARAKIMKAEGAAILDVGGESTRPGGDAVSEKEELRRVIPVIKALKQELDLPVSIDTTKPEVARRAMEAGACMINDVHGLQGDPLLTEVAASTNASLCIMHNNRKINSSDDIMEQLFHFFEQSLSTAQKAGISPDKLVLDPGIGFAKSQPQNFSILNRLHELKQFGLPILLGCSRKSMIGALDDSTPDRRIGGTVATTLSGADQGVDIIRVHDIHENYQALRTYHSIQTGKMLPKRSRKDLQ